MPAEGSALATRYEMLPSALRRAGAIWARALTGNGLGARDESGGRFAGEEDDGDGLGIVLGGGGVPNNGVGLASGDDLARHRLGDGVEPGYLGQGAGDEGQEGRGGDGELHLDGYTKKPALVEKEESENE